MTQVVVATKTSDWELHQSWYQEQFSRGRIQESDIARIKLAHDEHQLSVTQVKQAFEQKKIDYKVVSVDSEWTLDPNTKVLVTIGGDGTLLSASHKVREEKVVLFGLRSSGTSVGYLCAGGLECLPDLLKSIASNSFKVMSASRFHGEIQRVGEVEKIMTPPALNDLLYSNANPAGMTRYRLFIGDRQEEQKSSGMWLSTALGSTAGILAAGGVMQPKSDRNFQYLVRELYRFAGKNFYLVNGFFDPDTKKFMIENRCEKAILAADGNHSVAELVWGDRVTIVRSSPIDIATA